MACDIVTCRGAVFVLWGMPTTEDKDPIILALRAAVEQAGEPVVFVTRVPVDQPAPSMEVRRYVAAQRLLELAKTRGLLDASGPTSDSALLRAGR